MRNYFNCLYTVFIVLIIISCSKSSDEELPSLVDNDDVCTAMDDSKFMKWCYDNYDINGDGKVSKIEAAAVREFIPGSKHYFNSVKGLEYFTGIEVLDIQGTFTEIDFHHMTNLKSLFVVSNTKTYDLSNNPLLIIVTLKDTYINNTLNYWDDDKNNNEIESILETSSSYIKGLEKLNNPEIVLYGVFNLDKIDFANTKIKYTGALIVKKLTIYSFENDQYISGGFGNDVVFKNEIFHRYKKLKVCWQTINTVYSEDKTSSLKGTWKGNTYRSTYWSNYTYNATYTEITFLSNPYTDPSGSGYWVDYYSNAPWDYVANHIDWTVKNGVIRVYFIEEDSYIEIVDYHQDSTRFTGMINDSGRLVNFDLYQVSHPYTYWDDYRWGYDSWYDDYYWARTRRCR